MTSEQKREAVIAKAKSRLGKNQYTQGPKRTQVGKGFSDCSSFVRWCYLQVLGIDIGINTVSQITNKRLKTVWEGGKYPPKGTLKKGDLLYFKGSNPSRPYGVGHVEMFTGGSTLIGHGSGIGPKLKQIVNYCLSKWRAKRGFILAKRVIDDDPPEEREP